MNYLVVIVNGTGGSGKDTFVKYCSDYLDSFNINSVNLSTVDKIYKVAEILGWDGEKDNKSRKFLSDLKDIWSEYNDGPFNYILNKVNEIDEITYNFFVVFVHSREPYEIEEFKNYYKDLCTTVLIRRNGIYVDSNHADSNVENYNYDLYIENNSLDQLKESAIQFCNKFIY